MVKNIEQHKLINCIVIIFKRGVRSASRNAFVKNMSEITIVTGFFDINRKDMKGFKRTNDEYFEYFDKWARIKNKLIVFCSREHKAEIMNIREKYNLSNKTEVYEIENITSLDEFLFAAISKAMNNDYFKTFMYNAENPEVTNPLYNFLMCIKPLLVKLAIDKFKLEGTIAWLDFGFNKDLQNYPYIDDFNFEWEYDFDPNFVHLFAIKKIKNIPIFEVIRNMVTFIQGGTLIADSKRWSFFWEVIRENMLNLTQVGLCDDDQVLYLMAYNRFPEVFKIHEAYWNEAMKLYGGSHMTYISERKIENKVKHFLIKIISRKTILKKKIEYCFRTYRVISKGDLNDK